MAPSDKRRSFLSNIGIAGAALSATAFSAEARADDGKLSPGDVAVLRFLAAAEIIESDLWQQYNELGGVKGGNPAYILALQNLDCDMPQYIADNTDDELSHAAFLNAYLVSKESAPSTSINIELCQAARPQARRRRPADESATSECGHKLVHTLSKRRKS